MAYLGEEIKKLGFGLMRLPRLGDDFDMDQSKKMVDLFMQNGFTYFDTAWMYTGSEDAIRQALVERYPRESYQLATKLAAWASKTREEALAQFETSLKQTGAQYFDYYLLHNLGQSRTQCFDQYDIWDFVQEKKQQGLIKHVGFSAHTTAKELDAILTEHPEMEFVQLQINYADWESPSIQAKACYETARKHGKPVIVMEPVKGGMLAAPPSAAAEILRKASPGASAASWAIRFAASLEGVITVLSGMSKLEQLQDNLSCMKDFVPLTAAEQETIQAAQQEIDRIPLIACTACEYCAKVCPEKIGISVSLGHMNELTLYGGKEERAGHAAFMFKIFGLKSPAACTKCGQCEQACPQHIAIREELDKVHEALFV